MFGNSARIPRRRSSIPAQSATIFLDHCLKRLPQTCGIRTDDITAVTSGMYIVRRRSRNRVMKFICTIRRLQTFLPATLGVRKGGKRNMNILLLTIGSSITIRDDISLGRSSGKSCGGASDQTSKLCLQKSAKSKPFVAHVD